MALITLIPTPIGNLEDITLRAIRLMKEADLLAAEDTRTTGFLLKHLGISTQMTALHMHNEHKKVKPLLFRERSINSSRNYLGSFPVKQRQQ